MRNSRRGQRCSRTSRMYYQEDTVKEGENYMKEVVGSARWCWEIVQHEDRGKAIGFSSWKVSGLRVDRIAWWGLEGDKGKGEFWGSRDSEDGSCILEIRQKKKREDGSWRDQRHLVEVRVFFFQVEGDLSMSEGRGCKAWRKTLKRGVIKDREGMAKGPYLRHYKESKLDLWKWGWRGERMSQRDVLKEEISLRDIWERWREVKKWVGNRKTEILLNERGKSGWETGVE